MDFSPIGINGLGKHLSAASYESLYPRHNDDREVQISLNTFNRKDIFPKTHQQAVCAHPPGMHSARNSSMRFLMLSKVSSGLAIFVSFRSISLTGVSND